MTIEIKTVGKGMGAFVDGELVAAGTARQVANAVKEMIIESGKAK